LAERLQSFFGPLTSVTALLAISVEIVSLWENHPSRWLTLLAAVISILVVATFFLYFQGANLSFTTASLGVDFPAERLCQRVGTELTRWAMWHWWRTGLSFIAFIAAMLSFWHLNG
jgi:Domain of unknown function (DUF1772)